MSMSEASQHATAASHAPSAAALLASLEAQGITHIVALPDNATAPLLALIATRPNLTHVPVTREGEAFAIATGLWIGGQAPVVIIQNTGLLESGDALRGTATRMGVPLVFFVSWRGHAKLAASGIDPRARPARSDLVRADLDSVALITIPTLDAWAIPMHHFATDADVANIAAAFDQARREERPVAVLIPRTLE
jgi:sulfopyruvate decarboxylase TPP-binding subunit